MIAHPTDTLIQNEILLALLCVMGPIIGVMIRRLVDETKKLREVNRQLRKLKNDR